MKKIIVFCVAFLATMSLCASETSVKKVSVDGFRAMNPIIEKPNLISVKKISVDGIYYLIGEKKIIGKKGVASVTSGDLKYVGEVVIPSTVMYEGEEYSVTSIGISAFEDCSSLTSVTIPSSVTSIGADAFSGCSSLTSITIPGSVTTIGDDAFSGCSSLTSITIPDGVTKIGNSAFWYCSSLTSITIPESVTKIGIDAFYGTALYNTESNWDNNVLYIDNCLIKAKDIISGEYIIKNGTRLIGDGAFFDCSSLTSITIPESVTEIGNSAFDGCSSLTSITIPEGVTSIGDWAFGGCSSLTSITIPDGVTEIGENAFSGCGSLTSIDVASNNNNYASIDGVLFSKDKTILIQYPEGKATSYIIPDGVTSIGESAFYGCSDLISVTIPDGVTTIGDAAFSGCSSFTSITIPEGVTEIGDYAFDGCSDLTSITIPESVTSIGEYAFGICSSLTSITIPEGVTSIEDGAFSHCSSLTSITIPEGVTEIGKWAFNDCTSLTSITCKNTTPPEVGSSSAFEGVDKSIPLYVPAESVEAYKNAEYWKEFTNIQAIPSSSVANAKAETQDSVRKEYRDGQVLIIKGDKTYTMFGTEY